MPSWERSSPDTEAQRRFIEFVRELEVLSAKYGVVLQCVGNVYIEQDGPLEKVTYSKDPTSGDLLPQSTKRFDLSSPREWGY